MLVDDLWAMKSEDVGLIVRAISFQDFQPMCMVMNDDPPTSQTDGRTTCDSNTALCTVGLVHRAVETYLGYSTDLQVT